MNSQTRTTTIILIAVLAIVISGIALFAHHRPGMIGSSTGTSTGSAASSTNSTSTPGITGGYTVTPVGYPAGPDPKTPLMFSASIDASTRASLQSQFADVQSALVENEYDFNAWIALGNLRKSAGDYQGAVADYQYMNVLYPTNVISYANLADLYTNTLHDYPKAADSYAHALRNDPTQLYLYDNFYQLWRDDYRASGTALETTLKAGIKANPNAAHLSDLLATYEASK